MAVGSFFYGAFSVTRLYSVGPRVTSDDDGYTRANIHALSGI